MTDYRSAMEQKIAAKLAEAGERLHCHEGRFRIIDQFGEVSSRGYSLADLARKLGVYSPDEDRIDWYLNPLRGLVADPNFIAYLAASAPAGIPPLRWLGDMTLEDLNLLYSEWSDVQNGETRPHDGL